jgi:hypothetical protein
LDLLFQWYKLGQTAPALQKIAARELNIPPEDAQEVMQEQQAQIQAQSGGAGSGPGAQPVGQPPQAAESASAPPTDVQSAIEQLIAGSASPQ